MNEFIFAGEPALPLKGSGEIWHGCTSMQWAIDADGQAWWNNEYDRAMKRVDSDTLEATAEDAGERYLEAVYAAQGRKPPLPSWMSEALAAGWTPPATWSRGDFDQ